MDSPGRSSDDDGAEKIASKDMDRAVEKWLTLVERVAEGGITASIPQGAMGDEETRALIRHAGHEGLTLLKNADNLLPLCPRNIQVAVIGPNSQREITACGGASSSRIPQDPYTPFLSISKIAGTVEYAQGCNMHQRAPLGFGNCRDKQGNAGVTITWNPERGDSAITHHGIDIDFFCWNSALVKDIGPSWTARMTTYLTLPEVKPNKRTIAFMSLGPGRLYVNGELAIDLWDWTEHGHDVLQGSSDHYFDVESEPGKQIKLEVEFSKRYRTTNMYRFPRRNDTINKTGGFRIGFKYDNNEVLLQEAVEVARSADVAIVVVGMDPGWEAEGVNRPDLNLPFQGSQDRLIEAVAKANPRTVVVNQSGCPVSMPWIDQVPAILQSWYQGQEASHALADVLFGLANPSGKLPITFPKRIEDTPAFHNWPRENKAMVYGEGLYIGYRHYERAKIDPLFPFGHGLSYTIFEYGHVEVTPGMLSAGGNSKVVLAISNIGDRPGAETVQAYVHDEKSTLSRPVKELVAFEKVFLSPGQTKHVTLTLDKYSVGYYDDCANNWVAEKGDFQVLIGSSSADIRRTGKFSVNETFTWVF